MPGVWYTTREKVKAAVDVKNSARANEQIDRIIGDISQQIEDELRRVLHPHLEAFVYDYPHPDRPTPWRIWFGGKREIIELLALDTDGTNIPLTGVYLYPQEGPPYTHLELNRSGRFSFSSNETPQGAISGRALCGYTDTNEHLDVLTADLGLTDDTITIENGARVGVGSLLRCGDERMIVTEKQATPTGLSLAAPGLTMEPKSNTVVLSGMAGAPQINEMINIDGERMQVLDVLGGNVIVQRAVDGSVLAAHNAGAAIYAYRQLTLRRAAAGTTAATHTTGALLDIWVPPTSVEGLCVAASLVQLANENSAYARVVGSGDAQREARGAALEKKWSSVKRQLGRRVRMGAAGGGVRAG